MSLGSSHNTDERMCPPFPKRENPKKLKDRVDFGGAAKRGKEDWYEYSVVPQYGPVQTGSRALWSLNSR